jgi:hypothetical protein
MIEYIFSIDVGENDNFPRKLIILGKLYLNVIGRGENLRLGCWIQR